MDRYIQDIESWHARTLVYYMHGLSQDRYCAGWMTCTSDALWDFHENGTEANTRRSVWALNHDEVTVLRLLAALAGGWPVWREGSQISMVPLDEWRAEARGDHPF